LFTKVLTLQKAIEYVHAEGGNVPEVEAFLDRKEGETELLEKTV